MIEVGKTVQWKDATAEEAKITHTVVELNGDRCVIEANVDMPFRPTTVAMVADLVEVA